MRALFAFAGGSGHAEPLVPLAHVARSAGHDVAFTGARRVLPALARRGFEVLPSAPVGADPPPRRPLRAVDRAYEERVLRDYYAGSLARRRAEDVLALCARRRPDLVVCDEVDFGAMVAAERHGIPHATVLVTAAGSFVRPEVVAEPLDALRAEHGLPPDPLLAAPYRLLVLSPFPPSFRDPAFPLPPTARSVRLPQTPAPEDAAFAAPPRERPLVYFTLGTVFNVESGDLFSRVLAGLAQLDVDVVATVGRELDPRELGPLPARVRVERFLPQALVLPHCEAVVSHAGSGSVLGAVAHGLPSVLLPLGADQPLNADRAEELGCARVLDAVAATPGEVCDAVADVLTEPAYRAAAERLQRELEALPGPEHALALLERLCDA